MDTIFRFGWQFRAGSREVPPPPILLDQTEALRAEKNFFKTTPLYIRVWMTALLLSEGLDPPLQLVPLQHYT